MNGAVISDRYELGERLGSGGMSSVFKATDRVLERTVAVKILAEHLSDDDKFVARFRREALAVAKLIHPNIVQVYDTGVDADRHYIVMEYVEGRSGAQLLQSKGRLGPDISVAIGVQACAGLTPEALHVVAVGCVVLMQDLQRDAPLEQAVLRAEDAGHAAGADKLFELVAARDHLTDHGLDRSLAEEL